MRDAAFLNVVYHGRIAVQIAKDRHRNRAWDCWWLKRYKQEGIEGLKDRTKSGRPPKLSETITYRIKTMLKESNYQGWSTKQVEKMIIKESGIKYNHNYIYCILRRWGFRQKVPRKVHVNTASEEEKAAFKKRSARYLWISDTKIKTLK